MADRKVTIGGLDSSAAEALKSFAARNKAAKKYRSADSVPDPSLEPLLAQLVEAPAASSTEPDNLDAQLEDSLGHSLDLGTRPLDLGPRLGSRLKKFDIFENIDDDRLREFETVFQEMRATSNYDEFRLKAKKTDKKTDASKYTTVGCCEKNDDGQHILT